jgi:hypothetical protein
MKKLINLIVIMVMMIMLGFATHVEARKGKTASSTKTSKSSSSFSLSKSSSNTSKPSKSASSRNFSSFFGKNKKSIALGTAATAAIGAAASSESDDNKTTVPNSAFNSAFADAAKQKQAKTAWQEYNKSSATNPPLATLPAQDSTKQLEKQLADLKKQLETERNQARNERLVAQMTELARQIANTHRQPTGNRTLISQHDLHPVSNTSVSTTPVQKTAIKSPQSDHRGVSIFWIILALGGGVVVIIWLVKRNQSTTIYRI